MVRAPQNSGSAAALSKVFGNYHFNTNGLHPLGLPGYTFNSFAEASVHGNQSRFYAGVGIQYAVDAGAWIGNRMAKYRKNKIRFLK